MEHLHTVSLGFLRYHSTYATVLIAPSPEDSFNISHKLRQDNARRADIRGETDPGRDGNAD